MPSVDRHPSPVELEAFALGHLDNPATEAVEVHVAGCSACQQVIDPAPSDPLVTLLRSADSVSDTVKDAASADTTTDVPGAEPAASGSRTGVWSAADSASSEVPATLLGHPRYEAVRLLGHGGMGAVWLAEHRVMGRQVAVKVIRPELVARTGTAERFRREVQVAARLRHVNIVAAFDAEEVGETQLLAMEYIEGVNLADELRRRGPLPVAEACDVVWQAALGLQYAFECGLIHRDLKPHNLMRTADGTVKVLDFGLAVLADAADRAGGLTGQNVVLGTPDYIAPEQAEDSHAADVRSDVYSLGCTLYQLLTGRVPFPDESVLRKLDGHRMHEPKPVCDIRPDVPAGLSAVFRKMMAKKPAHRFQTPAEVAAALEPFAHPRPEKKRPRRWPWVAAAAALLCAVTAAGVAVHRIQTDNGELVITTESDDVEIVIKQGGKVVRIYDTKTDRSMTLRSGQYELELKDAGEGLKLSIDRATLTRGKTVLAKIERLPRPETKRQEKPIDAQPGKIELFQHIAVTAPGGFFYDIDVSKGGKYALVTRDIRGANELDVYDLQTGEQTMEGPGYRAAFLDDEHVVAANEGTLRVYEACSGNLLRQGPMRDFWGMAVAPGGKHLVYTNPLGCFLFDLTTMKELHGWTRTGPAASDGVLFSADGKRLFVRLDATEPWQVWDVEKNRAANDFAWLRKEDLRRFLPDGKTVLAIQDGKHAHLDATTGKVRATLRPVELPPGLQNFAVVTRGHFVLGGFTDGTVRLLALATPQELARFLFPENDHIRTEAGGWHACVAVSSDDQYAAVVTRRTLWIFRLPAVKVGDR